MQANGKAAELAKELGAAHYSKSQRGIGGGIEALDFPKSAPDNYKKIGPKYQNWYFPKASEKETLKRIAELPVIDYKELNQTLGFKGPQVVASENGLLMVSTPAISWNDKDIILSLPGEVKFSPSNDVVEILESEYNRIKTEIHSKAKPNQN